MATSEPNGPTKQQAHRRRKKRFSTRFLLFALLFIALVAGGVLAYRQYDKLKDENARLSDPQASAQAENDRLKSEVAALIEVPQGEEPNIVSVVDVEKLQNQPFFANAQNGDKILIFQQAKKAILYRPSTKKIIEVAPINLGDNASAGTKADQAQTNKNP